MKWFSSGWRYLLKKTLKFFITDFMSRITPASYSYMWSTEDYWLAGPSSGPLYWVWLWLFGSRLEKSLSGINYYTVLIWTELNQIAVISWARYHLIWLIKIDLRMIKKEKIFFFNFNFSSYLIFMNTKI